jgi:hypothetical protein
MVRTIYKVGDIVSPIGGNSTWRNKWRDSTVISIRDHTATKGAFVMKSKSKGGSVIEFYEDDIRLVHRGEPNYEVW